MAADQQQTPEQYSKEPTNQQEMMSNYETLRQRHSEQYRTRLSEHIQRTTWASERLRSERQSRLRALIRVGMERSPWHRGRLTHIDPDRLTEEDLPRIPPMTKDDLMGNFDGILTDRRLSRAMVESHLERLVSDAYLLDEYHVVASGGSSGVRGVFTYGWNGWLLGALTMLRFRARAQRADPEIGPNAVRAVVAAGKPTHMSFAITQTFGRDQGSVSVPATLPLGEIVARLNDLQPAMLQGYPSMLAMLARETQAGRLRLAPRMVSVASEPLLPEMRAVIEAAWGRPVLNWYATSEGASASSCGLSRGMHLNEDVCIFELVDKLGRPVVAGERAAKMYVTPLFNHAQPLIRYELTDEVTLLDEPCPCGSGMRRIDDIEGRADDVFEYVGGITVHPLTFRSQLGRDPHIFEYQVRQTERGAAIAVRAGERIETDSLRAALERELARLGVQQPEVTISLVDMFDQSQTGKLKRFIPLRTLL